MGGSTGLAIAPAVLPVLASNHISVAPIAPGVVRAGMLGGKKTVVFNFPIVGGKINPKDAGRLHPPLWRPGVLAQR